MSEWIRSFFSLSVITLSYQVPGRRSCAEKPTPHRLSSPRKTFYFTEIRIRRTNDIPRQGADRDRHDRGLGSDGVGRGEPCRAGNREHRLSRLRHDADSVFAWFRV